MDLFTGAKREKRVSQSVSQKHSFSISRTSQYPQRPLDWRYKQTS
jgi:hypothetical protein